MSQESPSISNKRNVGAFIRYLSKWAALCICISIVAGVAAAIFLASLDWVTNYRESHVLIIVFFTACRVTHWSGLSLLGKQCRKRKLFVAGRNS